MKDQVKQAVSVLVRGGVIAYPTEYCFGLGCDPTNYEAVQRILDIKGRSVDQGLILIAASLSQVNEYVDIDQSPVKERVLQTWPGPNTWTLAPHANVPKWIRGNHSSVAVRITSHSFSAALCQHYGHAIVSTSANRHTQAALLTADQVAAEMGQELDHIVYADVGGATQASTIYDGMSGETLRG